MEHSTIIPEEHPTGCYEIRFQSLFKEGRALAFPCNRSGQFDLDRAQPRLRDNYLFARAMMGREYAFPVVLRRPTEH